MDFYIESGRTLNDKDRTNNSDLAEIQEFFKPIDRLFGDYEIRKKLGFEQSLYRSNLKGEIVRISKEEILLNRDKVLTFYIKDNFFEYVIDYSWDEPEKIANELKDTRNLKETDDDDLSNLSVDITNYKIKALIAKLFQKPVTEPSQKTVNDETANEEEVKEKTLTQTFEELFIPLPKAIKDSLLVSLKAILVLEPSKLIHACELDEARNQSFKNSLLFVCFEDFNDWDRGKREVYYNVINDIKNRFKQKKLEEPDNAKPVLDNTSIEDFFKHNENTLEYSKVNFDIFKRIIEEFNKNEPLTKLKNFECLENVKLRLGQYEDGRFVIFLHPYVSESNNPIRIPQE